MRNEHEAEAIANLLETRNGCPSGFGLGPVCDKAADLLRRQHARIEDLEQELHDAATSLETISRLAGRSHYVGEDGEQVPTYMGMHYEVRDYAAVHAKIARALLAKKD